MQSKATTAAEYMDGVPEDRKPALSRLRALCLEILEGYTEVMEYGMPSYKKGEAVEVAFCSQKGFIALYVLRKDVMDAYRDEFPDAGKGCIRYSKPDKIDFEIVEKLLLGTATAQGKIC
jgi:uncharacterized protein YdhG (YjbR/CyaY superfamily)